MATATMQGVFSASISRLDNLSTVKTEVFKIFEMERNKIHPKEVIVFVDGEVFRLDNEDDYDKWSLATTHHVLNKSDQKKVVCITVFVG